MSTAALPTLLTVEEFLQRPDRWDGCYEELVEGEVYVSPNVKRRHNDLVERLTEFLRPLKQKGYVVLGEVACRVTSQSLPNTDVAVIRRDRWEAVDPTTSLANRPHSL